MAEVARLFVCVAHRHPMREIDEGELIADKGMKDCIHGRAGSKRQVLLMAEEVLEALNLRPGIVRENITTRELDHSHIAMGKNLKVGGAILEATGPCEPCHQMDEIRNGLKAELRGRRGWLCRVVQGGMVRRGDQIEFVESAAPQAAD